MSDVIEQYEQQLATEGVLSDPTASTAIANLKTHPCRGCPNLRLSTPPDAGHPEERPDGYVLARPYCTVFPELANRPETSERHPVYRETWTRCPLYGINSIQALFQNLTRRIDTVEAEVKRQSGDVTPEPPPEATEDETTAQNLRWLKDAFKILGLSWSPDFEDRNAEIAKLWSRLKTPVEETDDGTVMVECRRGAGEPDDARYHYWLTRWSQDHFEIHDDAWVAKQRAPLPAD